MTAPALTATPELVATAWLRQIPGLPTGCVDPVVPVDASTWPGGVWVSPRTTGGAPAVSYPLRGPVVTIDCWADAPGSAAPPWNLSACTAESVVAAALDLTTPIRTVTLPAGFPQARVIAVWVISEPRRAYGDAGGYAHHVMDVAMRWVTLP